MELLPAFPDVELLALDLLASAGTTSLTTPATITPPLIVIRRVGGGDTYLTDVPRLQVHTFGANRAQTAALAEACRQLILASPADGVGSDSIDNAWTETAPIFHDWGDKTVQCFVATYRIALRRPR
jgi:hypothetical protein